MEADIGRRNSMPSRLRTASVSSSMGDGSNSDAWPASTGQTSSHFEINTPPSSVVSIDLKRGPDPNDRAVTCLLAEDNPITAKIIETLLIRLGCRCIVVADGSEAISVAMGDISEWELPASSILKVLTNDTSLGRIRLHPDGLVYASRSVIESCFFLLCFFFYVDDCCS